MKFYINEILIHRELFNGLTYLESKSHNFAETVKKDPVKGEKILKPELKKDQEVDQKGNKCQTCSYNFTSRDDQIFHYQSDWHRYNIKITLLGKTFVTEEYFENIVEDLSSISGSDSDTDSSLDNDTFEKNTNLVFSKFNKENNLSQSKSISKPISQLDYNGKSIQFKNSEDKILTIYTCIIPFRLWSETHENYDEDIFNIFKSSFKRKTCIILFNAGHFAAAIFEYDEPITHKTFHRYVVRAKRGTVQSQRDNKGSAPKSGGASIRRYNEAALTNDIQKLLQSWKKDIDSSMYIFIRYPKYNKDIFYGGKNPILQRNDPRIHGIPFPTRRPIFKEIEKVYREIFSVTVNSFNLPHVQKSSPKNNQSIESQENKKSNAYKSTIPVPNKDKSPKLSVTGNVVNTESIYINMQLISDTGTSNINEIQTDNKLIKQEAEPIKETVLQKNEIYFPIIDELFTMCKTGDISGLSGALKSLSVSDKEILGNDFGVSVDDDNNTLLHVAAKSGKTEIITELLTAGCNPCLKNKFHLTPYSVSCDKVTRNTFRKFMANNPNKFDYTKANIPGPLTDEMEAEMKLKQNQKKKAQRQSKQLKKKQKETKQETERLESEQKEKFASLSDREKRALAAEKRISMQMKEKGIPCTLSSNRCWKCGESLLGKVPFQYLNFSFCSIHCLKCHKGLVK